jgi:hypothetical protein
MRGVDSFAAAAQRHRKLYLHELRDRSPPLGGESEGSMKGKKLYKFNFNAV